MQYETSMSHEIYAPGRRPLEQGSSFVHTCFKLRSYVHAISLVHMCMKRIRNTKCVIGNVCLYIYMCVVYRASYICACKYETCNTQYEMCNRKLYVEHAIVHTWNKKNVHTWWPVARAACAHVLAYSHLQHRLRRLKGNIKYVSNICK